MSVDRIDSVAFEFRYDGWLGGICRLVGLGRRWTRVTVDDEQVVVRMSYGFRTTIPRQRMQRVSRAVRPFVGWGVHGWRGRWLVNGSLQGIVAIEIEPPVRAWVLCFPVRLRTAYISLVDPDGFVAALDAPSSQPLR